MTHFACRLFVLLLAIGLVACTSTKPVDQAPQWQTHGPFEIRFAKTATWGKGMVGYDPDLPGYHVSGDIASLRLRPAAGGRPPEKLVLAISTSPGQKPHLDHFRLAVLGGQIEIEPFAEQARPRVMWTGRERNTFQYAERGAYFTFAVVGDEVQVVFQADVMELLSGECSISWIDWYR